MATPAVPDDLKAIAPYLKRAEELEGRDPVMAYYCRYYAVTLGASKRTPQNSSTVTPFLLSLADRLAQLKEELGPSHPAILDTNEGKAYVLTFASKVFLRADNEDRAGNASSKTARAFFAAATFLEVLRHFGAVDEQVEERIKYAKWKAADILKAEKEGRRPVPGPPGGDEFSAFMADGLGVGPAADEPAPADHAGFGLSHGQPPMPSPSSAVGYPGAGAMGGAAGFQQPFAPGGPGAHHPSHGPPSSPSFPTQPPQYHPQNYSQPPQHQAPAPPSPQAQQPGGFGNGYPAPPILPARPGASGAPGNNAWSTGPASASVHPAIGEHGGTIICDPAKLNQASKHARFAISAMQYEDIPAAIDNFEKGLAILREMQRR